jgi:hypothetical protein
MFPIAEYGDHDYIIEYLKVYMCIFFSLLL